MKKLFYVILASGAVCSCGGNRGQIQRKVEAYATVTIPAPDLSDISDNGKEVLNLYRFAANEADAIYWKQYSGDKSWLESIQDPSVKDYANINYGPWDRIDGKAFVPGFSALRPSGANFYPLDMTAGEYEAFDDPAKDSPYTLIRRGEDGSLRTVWYHDAYAPEIDKICNYLTAAADITIKESVRKYLLAKVDALRTDDYYESENAWLDMEDSKMDLVIGPIATADDELYGSKASYGALVLLKDLPRTEQLSGFGALLPELQKALPGPDEYKTFVPGTESNVFVCNAIHYSGFYNAGFKVIAVNLPSDPRLQAEKGTRTILLGNVMRDKFNRTVFPVGTRLFNSPHTSHLDADAFYWNIVFREIAHGLGVKETVNGKGSVEDALGNEAVTIEKAKDNVLGVYLACKMIGEHRITALIQKEDALATFLASVIRSSRFGGAEATGRANIMIYNWLLEKGAYRRTEGGRYDIDYRRMEEAIGELGAYILKIQATGDYDEAVRFANSYSDAATLRADIVNIELEKIPVDVKFEYEK